MRLLLFFLTIVVSSSVYSKAPYATAKTIIGLSKQTSTSEVVRLGNLSPVILRQDTKSNNIRGIIDIAAKEGRIGSSLSEQVKLQRIFSSIDHGDEALLACLKAPSCDADLFVSKFSECIISSTCIDNFRRVSSASSLHNQVAVINPTVSYGASHASVGKINETLMTKFFESSGWRRMEGEVGRQGIDGLFVKRGRDGQVADVMFVEAKANTSQIGQTLSGQQMSKEWLLNNIARLEREFPNNSDYTAIRRFVENDSYRSRLWHMKANGAELVIDLQRIDSLERIIALSRLSGGEMTRVNYQGNGTVNLINPQNQFQIKVRDWYFSALDEIQ